MFRTSFAIISILSLTIVLPALGSGNPGAILDNKAKTPPKKTPPAPPPPPPHHMPYHPPVKNRPQVHNPGPQQQYQNWNWAFSPWMYNRYYPGYAYNPPRWNYPAYASLLPGWAYPFAGLLPNYNPATPRTPTPSGPSQADLDASLVDKEFVLAVAANATVTALKPKVGGGTAYFPSKIDALKVNQVVSVLVKPAVAGDKPVTYTLTGTVTDPGEGTDRAITLKARVSPTLADLDVADKVVTAVTIKSLATAAK